MTNRSETPCVRYHLRIVLDPGFETRQEPVLDGIIRRGCIDEALFFVPHAEDLSPGLGTDAECQRVATMLEPLFARLRERGVAPSINMWWTMSFSGFPAMPRDLRASFPDFRWAVGADGTTSTSAACPLDGAWRREAKRLYRTFAALHPERLWIDDDVAAYIRAEIQGPCLCPACLAEMAKRTGTAYDRQELVRAVLADPPNPVREAWLAFQSDLMLEIFRELGDAVHEVSPETALGVMHSAIESHFAQGRDWTRQLAVLGTPQPWCRPTLACYSQGSAVDVLDGLNFTRLAQAALPAGTPILPEVENWPHSRWYKSVRMVRAHMGLCQLLGLDEITLSIQRFTGRIDLIRDEEQEWYTMLGASKPWLQAIADLGIRPDQFRGIGLFFHPDIARHVQVAANARTLNALTRHRPLDATIAALGFATRYGQASVTVVTHEQPLCLDDASLEALFSGGVLLDARAAEALCRRGRGDLAGILGRAEDGRGVNEMVVDDAFGGAAGERISIRMDGIPWQFRLPPAVREISVLCDYGGRRTGHGIVLFENSLGGRVAVLPYDSQAGGLKTATFMCYTRQAQLLAVFEWLGRAAVPCLVRHAACALPLVAEQDGRLIIGVINTLSDPVTGLRMRLAAPGFPVRAMHGLQPDGTWRPLACRVSAGTTGGIEIATDLRIDHMDVAVLTLHA